MVHTSVPSKMLLPNMFCWRRNKWEKDVEWGCCLHKTTISRDRLSSHSDPCSRQAGRQATEREEGPERSQIKWTCTIYRQSRDAGGRNMPAFSILYVYVQLSSQIHQHQTTRCRCHCCRAAIHQSSQTECRLEVVFHIGRVCLD